MLYYIYISVNLRVSYEFSGFLGNINSHIGSIQMTMVTMCLVVGTLPTQRWIEVSFE